MGGEGRRRVAWSCCFCIARVGTRAAVESGILKGGCRGRSLGELRTRELTICHSGDGAVSYPSLAMNRPTLWFCQTAARNPPKRQGGCTIVGCLLARETQGFQEVYPLLALDLEAAQAVDQGLLGLGGGGEVGGDAARSIAVADLVEGLPPASHGLGLVALALVVDCRRACEVALVVGFLEKGGWRFSAAQHGDARMLPTSRSTWASGGCSRRPSPAVVVWWVRESRGRCWGGEGCSWWTGSRNCENGCAAGQDSRHCIRDGALGFGSGPQG